MPVWLHPVNATTNMDGCSSSLAQLRQKAHTKLRKNSVNLKCKHLQIFPTVADQLLCPHTHTQSRNKCTICIPSNTLVHIKPSIWDESTILTFFFSSPVSKQDCDNSSRAETVPTPPTLSSRDTWIYTWGEWWRVKSERFTPIRGNALPKSLWSFSLVSH